MIIHDVVQQTPEWDLLRLLFPFTGSKAQAIQAQGKGLDTLITEKLAAVYSSNTEEKYTNPNMEHGNDMETIARTAYWLETGHEMKDVGFITNSRISPLAGVSLDGMGKDRNCEIKCPTNKVYWELLMHYGRTKTIKIQSAYMWQMQMGMMFSEQTKCDFIVFNNHFEKQMLIQTVHADKEKFGKIKAGLKIACSKYDEEKKIYEDLKK